jgi:hypothetical protein
MKWHLSSSIFSGLSIICSLVLFLASHGPEEATTNLAGWFATTHLAEWYTWFLNLKLVDWFVYEFPASLPQAPPVWLEKTSTDLVVQFISALFAVVFAAGFGWSLGLLRRKR